MKYIIAFLLFCCVYSNTLNKIAFDSRINNCPYSDFKRNNCYETLRNSLTLNNDPNLRLGTGYNRFTHTTGLPVLDKLIESQNVTTITGNNIQIPTDYHLENLTTEYVMNQHLFENYTSFNNYLSSGNNIYYNGFNTQMEQFKELFNGQVKISITEINYPLYNLSYSEKIHKLDKYMIEAIEMLPESFNDTIYRQFIDYWGTDVVISAIVGGKIERMVASKSCYVSAVNGFNVMDQEQQRMIQELKLKYTGNILVDTNYNHFRSAQVYNIFGGNPTIVDINDFDKRVKTFDGKYSVFTKVQTEPLYNYIKNVIVRENMKKLIEKIQIETIQDDVVKPVLVRSTMLHNGYSWNVPIIKSDEIMRNTNVTYKFCDLIDFYHAVKIYFMDPNDDDCSWDDVMTDHDACRLKYQLANTGGRLWGERMSFDSYPIYNHQNKCKATVNRNFSCVMDNEGYVTAVGPGGNGTRVNKGCSVSYWNLLYDNYLVGLNRRINDARGASTHNNLYFNCCIDRDYYFSDLNIDFGHLSSKCKTF